MLFIIAKVYNSSKHNCINLKKGVLTILTYMFKFTTLNEFTFFYSTN